jgi:hypothetical protein
MSTADRSVWFVGDLDDPWIVSLAKALPAGSPRVSCAGDLPDDWPGTFGVTTPPPRVVVVHRALLTPVDAERLARLRASVAPTPRVILCVGPYARPADLERWSARGVVDTIIPEATARDTIARHLDTAESHRLPRCPQGPRPRIAVVSAHYELRRTLADACEVLGYPAVPACDWSEATPTGPAVWDVPVLEPDWPRALARRSRVGPVVALLGFAGRALVRQARAHGASACLELPYDVHGLAFVLDRVAAARAEPAHAIPPPPRRGRAGPLNARGGRAWPGHVK